MRVLTREQWGARPDLPRRGRRVAPLDRTEVYIHHTVITDSDATPNEWESLGEVRARMRDLQIIRSGDLGDDVPYSMVVFCMADGDLTICEGRGLERSGAHTPGHNDSAFGIAIQGNFESGTLPRHFDVQLAGLGKWLRGVLLKEGFFNLGKIRPPDRDVWGHRDAKATLCPGQQLYDRLSLIRFVENEMAMDKATWKAVQRALQALDPPLYAGKVVDGIPGRNTDIAIQAFERRHELESRGVMGEANDPEAGIWPATRELLFATAAAS